MNDKLLKEIKKYFPEWSTEAQEALAKLIDLVYGELVNDQT